MWIASPAIVVDVDDAKNKAWMNLLADLASELSCHNWASSEFGSKRSGWFLRKFEPDAWRSMKRRKRRARVGLDGAMTCGL